MRLVLVKGESPNRGIAWPTRDDQSVVHADFHPGHDLPYLVVESLFALPDGEWTTRLSGGERPNPDRAADLPTAILVAKQLSNAVTNLFGDGPDTAAGVRERAGPSATLDAITDATIESAITAVRVITQRWASLPIGGTLDVSWPLGTADLRE